MRQEAEEKIIRHMRFLHSITKSKNTHSEYLTIIAFRH